MSKENKNSRKEKPKEKDFSEIEKELQDCLAQKDEYLAGWQRAKADFLNYKREESERMKNFLSYAQEEFLLKILPILDNFEMAEKKMPEELKDDENVRGIIQIKKQIEDFLKSYNVEPIESIGKEFDPHLHEAIDQIKIEDKEPDIVIDEIQKGYKINDKLLRPAKVRVNK